MATNRPTPAAKGHLGPIARVAVGARREFFAVAFPCPPDPSSTAAVRQGIDAAVGTPGRVLRAREGTVAALCELRTQETHRASVERIRVEVAKLLKTPSLSMGVGHFRPNTAGAYLSVLQAHQALLLGLALGRTNRVTSYDELGPYSFILGRPTRDIRRFCKNVLGPLYPDGQRTRNENLIATLECFVQVPNVSAVARELKVHRNTVSFRLRRASQLTKLDLGKADDRLSMQMALIGRRALHGVDASLAKLRKAQRPS